MPIGSQAGTSATGKETSVKRNLYSEVTRGFRIEDFTDPEGVQGPVSRQEILKLRTRVQELEFILTVREEEIELLRATVNSLN